MEKRPTKCPICGSKITRITNAVTRNSYFKCSNKNCHFVLGEHYTDAEFYLQGRTLSKTCLKCHNPLEVANGPHGLYARCFKCNCDTKPTTYNGKTYQRWANTHTLGVSEEIESLIKNFNAEEVKVEDSFYDFDAFIASTSVKNTPKDTISVKILSLLSNDAKVPFSAQEIRDKIDAKIGSVRTSLLSLRSLNLIKIVGCTKNPAGNHTILYQTTDSPLPSLTIHTKEEGYNSIASFLKENTDKYGAVIRAKEVLIAALQSNKIKPVLFNSAKGICNGYEISVMEELMSNKFIKHETAEASVVQLPRTREENKQGIINFFKKDTMTPFTSKQIAAEMGVNRTYIKTLIKELKKSKKIKVVGWDYIKGRRGATALQYQVIESPLPKLKTTVDNNLYTTLLQFYKKKLVGKRVTSIAKAQKAVEHLPSIPLLINDRAYVGYSVADLKKTFKNYISPSKRSNSIKVVPVEPDIEAAVIQSKITKENPVSNPIAKKKSFFSTITSFFKREKVNI